MADIDLCPRCQAPLKFNGAKSCECGWKKRERETRQEKPREPVDCAYAGCKRDATIKLKTKTGWANMCGVHHDAYHLALSKQYTTSLGLKTVKELAEFCRTREIGKGKMHGAFKANFERTQYRERVPGEDDEVREVSHA